MRIVLDTASMDDYGTFLKVKALPQYEFQGRTAVFPDEYADRLGLVAELSTGREYKPIEGLFDYQRDITALAITKRKFCVFADCGLGKTLIFLEFVRHATSVIGKRKALIVSPLMVIPQTIQEAQWFYGGQLAIEQVPAADLARWLSGAGGQIGITNFEAIRPDLSRGTLGALVIDESSMLKSHYGKWGTKLIEMGKGLEWKMCCSGTPAPNDRIEYANHAVFMDAYPNVNAFLARFFINRGQTGERWELKRHSVGAFYKALSHWSIFLSDPSVYGWKDGCEKLPPINVNIHNVPMTPRQEDLAYTLTGELFAHNIGGIGNRSQLGQIAKGTYKGEDVPTNKPAYIRDLVDSWPGESTIIWCLYNYEQDTMEKVFPGAVSIRGSTPHSEKQAGVDAFKAGRVKVLITKPKILGFGLNLQIATRQVFSGLQDSYESYYQAVKRSNRYGATMPLNVHIPITDIERPMIETVLSKANMIAEDTRAQEKLFREASIGR